MPCWGREVFGNPQRPCVRFDQPHAPVPEISEERVIPGVFHVTRPYDLGRIDIGLVIDPFLMDVMVC